MIDSEPPVPGDYRITENTTHDMGVDWSFRYGVETLRPAGKFLFWSWPERWRAVGPTEHLHDTCQNYIRAAVAGELGIRVVSYHKGNG